MRVLFIGYLKKASNTSSLRCTALKRHVDTVDVVNVESLKLSLFYKISNFLFIHGLPVCLPDNNKSNYTIRKFVEKNVYDIVWVDKGLTVKASTLEFIKHRLPKVKLVHYSPDNQVLRHNQSQQYLDSVGIYDLHVTTKQRFVGDLKRMGAKEVVFVHKSFEKTFHQSLEVTKDERELLGGDVGFVGTYEKERFESIKYLAQNGISVKVFGAGKWPEDTFNITNLKFVNKGLYDVDYVKSFRCFKISLCFLRKINYDQQTSRSVEIPACGGFMLAERTAEHKELFEEGKEAVFFSSNEELLEKCRYYLSHEDERMKIAEAGHRRCIESDFSNDAMICRVLKNVNALEK